MVSNDPEGIESKKKFVNIFHNPVTAWFILGLSLTLTFIAYNISNTFVQQRAKDRFEFRAHEVEKAIEDRLRIYEQQLWSGVGLIYASGEIDRAKWAKFVETMNIEKHWPGIQGFGYAIPVKPEEKEAHIESIQAEGFPEYTIKPEGERDMYSAIIYLEPFDWRNKRAFGYDMWSNEMRRAAMRRTRDHGNAVTSGIITLVQETETDVQKGFLTYVPVYRTRTIPKTIKERREQFVGWVYAAYRAGNLMQGIIGTEDPTIEFEVFDGEGMDKEALLFDSNASHHLEEENHNPAFKREVQVVNQERTWTLYFSTPKDFLSSYEQAQPRFVAIAGIIVDFLLFYVIWSLYFINKRAESIAEKMTREISESKDELETVVKERTAELQKARDLLEEKVSSRTKELNEKMTQLQRTNDAMVGREKRMIALKKENKQLKKKLGIDS